MTAVFFFESVSLVYYTPEIKNSGPHCLLSQRIATSIESQPKKACANCNLKLMKQLAHCLTYLIEMVYLFCNANSTGRDTHSFSYLHMSMAKCINRYKDTHQTVCIQSTVHVCGIPAMLSISPSQTVCSRDPPGNSLIYCWNHQKERKNRSPTISTIHAQTQALTLSNEIYGT